MINSEPSNSSFCRQMVRSPEHEKLRSTIASEVNAYLANAGKITKIDNELGAVKKQGYNNSTTEIAINTDHLWSPERTASFVGSTTSSLASRHAKGKFPKPQKQGNKVLGWHPSKIYEWIAQTISPNFPEGERIITTMEIGELTGRPADSTNKTLNNLIRTGAIAKPYTYGQRKAWPESELEQILKVLT